MNEIPSTKALRCFYTVAKLGGIRIAAEELSVTQSAVSHQISQLEDLLGVKVFSKQGRNLVLTAAGQNYLRHVESLLKQLEQATVQASRYTRHKPLTISAPPSFISNWLLQHLSSFELFNTGIEIRILEALTFDRTDTAIDLAIEYRFRPNPGLNSQSLLQDDVLLVAAPKLVKKKKLHSLDDLRSVRLIETERRLSSWLDIFWDQPWVRTHSVLSVPYSHHALEAASLGHGVAIANRLNAQRFIDSKELVIPFKLPKERVPEVPSYFLTLPHDKLNNESVVAFRDWLVAKTQNTLEHAS